MRKILALILALTLMGCPGPMDPDPLPTPTPSNSSSPSPLPPNAPHFVISGRQFHPPLLGVSFCCDDPETPSIDEGYAQGWPLATTQALSDLRSRTSRINLVHMRSGPFRVLQTVRQGGARVQWDGDTAPLREAVLTANRYGFAVEVDVIDGWGLRHGELVWPDGCSVTRSAPQARHLEWAKEVANATSGLEVIYHIGNELSLCKPSVRWVRGIRDAIREIRPDAVIGSDSFPEEVDYETYHSGLGDIRPPREIERPDGSIWRGPLLHNESNNLPESADDYEAFIEAMGASGSYVAIWWGPMRNDERAELLRRLQ